MASTGSRPSFSNLEIGIKPLLDEVLPRFVFNSLCLNHFEQDFVGTTVVVERSKIRSTIELLYPGIGCVNWCQLYTKMRQMDRDAGELLFEQSRHDRANASKAEVESLVVALDQLLPASRAYLAAKKMSFSELRGLTELNANQLTPVDELCCKGFSKQQFVQCLEPLIEALLMDLDLSPLSGLQSFADFYAKLWQIRYPRTFKNDQAREHYWQQFKWPKRLKADFHRHGDKHYVTLRAQIHSPADLQRLIGDLKRIERDL